MSVKQNFTILLLEDDEADAELIRELLSESRTISIKLARADRLSSAATCLAREKPDIILSDLDLPDSKGIDTFIKVHDLAPDMPVMVLTGLNDEETAILALRKGAQDYLVKGTFDANLLSRSIIYSIERKKLMIQLEHSLREIRTLKGMIPICAWCRKLRDDDGYWKQVEAYLSEHTDAQFTHGVCPECSLKLKLELDSLT